MSDIVNDSPCSGTSITTSPPTTTSWDGVDARASEVALQMQQAVSSQSVTMPGLVRKVVRVGATVDRVSSVAGLGWQKSLSSPAEIIAAFGLSVESAAAFVAV